jgi:hypothetical protein
MSYLDIFLSPDLLEESRRELERERRREWQIREARAALRLERPSRLTFLTAFRRQQLPPDPCGPLVEGC